MDDPDLLVCSAKGCPATAVWACSGTTPSCTRPDRRKTWLACDEHRQSLSDFLEPAQFLKDVVPVADRPVEDRPSMAHATGW